MKDITYSLSRFFHKKNPSFPCRVAGFFKAKSRQAFELHSQGCVLACGISLRQAREISALRTGDGISAEIIKTGGKYKLISWKKLTDASDPAVERISLKEREDWMRFLSVIKRFFCGRGVAAVETPSLVACPGTEPHLAPFKTVWIFPDGKRQVRFLPTSPEMHLKKLLCRGWTDIFEIKKCFRNKELGALHLPEFYLLEWYRAFFSLKQLARELSDLLKRLSREAFFKGPLKPVQTKTVAELFRQHLNFPLTPNTSKKDLARLLQEHQIPFSRAKGFEELFHLLFLNKIEPQFEEDTPLIVRDYPLCLRGFARKNKQGWADRFELYWRGFELANAFFEVTDFREQRRLFQSHLKQRKDSVPADGELLRLMKTRGLPPCSGIAVGLDRLFSALRRKKDISPNMS